jgi:hypothetical protein
VVWNPKPVEDSIDQSLTASPALDNAIEFLHELLSDGSQIAQQEIVRRANERGIKIRTLYRAYDKLRIKSNTIFDKENRKHKFWCMEDRSKE